MKTALLIVNPSSGGEKAREYQELAQKKLETFFDCVLIKETQKAGDATAFAKQAAKDRLHSVFVMGGDGTVNEGISGLAEEDYRPTFGFFPLGTVNDLARALAIPLDPTEAIQAFDIEEVGDLDIGKINNRYFMNVIGIGTIPEAINDVQVEDKTKFGKLAYFASGLAHMIQNQSHNFHLKIDHKELDLVSSTLLIGLTNSIGGFETILPQAKVNDGLLHLVYFKDKNLLETVQALPNIVTGIEEDTNTIGYETFTKGYFQVKDGTLSTNIDGDEGPSLPITVQVLPAHLKVYRPQPRS